MVNKANIVTKIINRARKNGFKFGNIIKAPDGFRYYGFEVYGGDDFGYGIKLQHVQSVPTGSEFSGYNFDFTSLLLSKKFMSKLLHKNSEIEHLSTILITAYRKDLNTAIDLLTDVMKDKEPHHDPI